MPTPDGCGLSGSRSRDRLGDGRAINGAGLSHRVRSCCVAVGYSDCSVSVKAAPDRSPNAIIELDDAALPRTGWCFVPRVPLVAGDVMLAQKIALETDERSARAVAINFTPR